MLPRIKIVIIIIIIAYCYYCCTVNFTRYGFVKEVMDKYKVQELLTGYVLF